MRDKSSISIKTPPSSTTGRNGDLRIAPSSGGVKLFAKHNNRWYSSPLSVYSHGTPLQESIYSNIKRDITLKNNLTVKNDTAIGNDLTVENDITMNGDVFQMGSGHNYIYGNTSVDYDITMKK